MRKAKYIVIEGTEGVGKTTQVEKLYNHLIAQGKDVLLTKEPGTPHYPLTIELRKIMLDASYNLPRPARELISQAIRSLHMDKVVVPALETKDFIIQDRGLLTALSYGEACDNDIDLLKTLGSYSLGDFNGGRIADLYDKIIVLVGDTKKGLKRAAAAKQEFAAGDAIEQKGETFMETVGNNFKKFQSEFQNVIFLNVDGKSIDEVFVEILKEI
jgi:dTMP kinase